jgi:alpha-amylase
MRDAGFRIDRILLTRNPNFTPERDPDHWRDQNIYQIITDRFFDGDPSNNNTYGGADPSVGNRTHGGDFAGIERKLDYIKALGATAIWISPVVRNGGGDFDYHGYAGTDFYDTDPRFGSIPDLQRLVREAHRRGILVVNDVVVNHGSTWVDSGDQGWASFRNPPDGYNLRYNSGGRTYAPPFDNASLQAQFGNTALTNIFNNNGATSDWSNATQVELGELVSLDDFRTQSSYIRDKMTEIYSWWIATAGFDAFRIDTVKHVEMGFWDHWCPRIRSAAAALDKPNFLQFGEVYDGSDAKCGSYTGTRTTAPFKMDSVLDYPLYYRVNSVFATATGGTNQIEDRYAALNSSSYDPSSLDSLVTFLDNHDQNRFLNAGGGTARLEVALAFLYTSRGIPNLYYGTEQDFDGGADPWNREDMFDGEFEGGPSSGDNFNMTHPRFRLVAKLNNLRRLYPALRRGTHVNQWMETTGPGLLAYSRRLGSSEAFIVLNTSGNTRTIAPRATIHPPGTILLDALEPSRRLTVADGAGGWEIPGFDVPPNSYAVFIAESEWQPLDPVVVATSPAHDASSIPTTAAITLEFSKPMDQAATAAAISTSPPTTGTFAWSVDGTSLTYTPAGLAGNTLHHIRISEAARSTDGLAFHGAFESRFTTAASSGPSPPAVGSSSARVEGDTTASLTASVNPNGATTSVRFEYGPTSDYGGSTAWTQLASTTSSESISATLQNLTPGTTYHYRVVASNAVGTTNGPDATFTTTSTLPTTTAATLPATALGTTSAMLNASINPNGNPTTAWFEHGAQPNLLENKTPVEDIGTTETSLSAVLDGLQPDTTYFFRVVAANDSKTIPGSILSFTTLPVKPVIGTTTALAPGHNSVTLSATVDPRGSATTLVFEYGPDIDNLATTTPLNLAADAPATTLETLVEGLAPGTPHVFRAVATNAFGTTTGRLESFTTGFQPPSVTQGGATVLSTTSASLSASINPNGTTTLYWFEYGTTPDYGSSTLDLAADDAESYSSFSYDSRDNNGGSGFGPFESYSRTSNSRGGIRLVDNSSTNGSAGRQIDGNNSFGVFAGTSTRRGTHSGFRPLLTPRDSGILALSLRFDISNETGFTGIGLKAAEGSSFGSNELLSIGMAPATGTVGGNSSLLVTDAAGQHNLDLGTELRGRIIDIELSFDTTSGTYTLTASLRGDTATGEFAGSLKLAGPSIALTHLAHINGNTTGDNAQHLVIDNLAVSSASPAGDGFEPLAMSATLANLEPDTTYHFRAVASNAAGTSLGADSLFFTGSSAPPVVSGLGDQQFDPADGPITLDLVLGDADSPTDALTITATSDNHVLLPDENITLSGTGASRTLTITPADGATGNATVTITVSDGVNSTVRTFSIRSLLPAISVRVTPAMDSTSDPAYESNNFNGSNGGFGFGPWSVTAANGGSYVGVAGLSDALPRAFSIYSDDATSGSATAVRPLASALPVGESLSLTLAHTGIATGGMIGLRFLADGSTRFSIHFQGGEAEWFLNDGGSDFSSGIGWDGNSSLRITLTRLEGDSYSISVRSPNGQQLDGSNFTSNAGPMAIDTIELFSTAQGAGENVGINALERTAASSTAITFGETRVLADPATTFLTLTNSGEAMLTGLARSIEGEAAADFTAQVPPTSSLAPGDSLVLTLVFAPSAGGTRNATLLLGGDTTPSPTALQLTGTALNDPPTISSIPDQSTHGDPLAFTISDLETPADALTLSATSSNSLLLPDANITFGGTGTNRTATLAPLAGNSGNTSVTITVHDGDLSASTTFTLSVATTGFDGWIATTGVDPARRGPTDRNGPLQLRNLVAYAIGVDPFEATATDLPSLEAPIDSSFTLVWLRSKSATGIRTSLLATTSLTAPDWQPPVVLSESTTDLGDRELVRTSIELPATPAYFIRLHVEPAAND